jgi:Na+/H+ antiporter NhaD/arsenite permease-like protein
MITAVLSVFAIGYLGIIFEHQIHINKTATALLTGIIGWTVIMVMTPPDALWSTSTMIKFLSEHGLHKSGEAYQHFISHSLSHHLAEISEILFFLLGAMTIVELIDAHDGFNLVTRAIKQRRPMTLLWVFSILTFFLSALLDNLTTAIVMVSLLRKIIKNAEHRKIFACMMIIAANAGGAWSPMGDVTTTMLWIGGQLTVSTLITKLLIPSMVCMIVPLLFAQVMFKGIRNIQLEDPKEAHTKRIEGQLWIFFSGVIGLVSVPVFKTLTHLPPYTGMLLALGMIWVVSELIHKDKDIEVRKRFSAAYALQRIDTSSILFFLGILLSISALQTVDLLNQFSGWMQNNIANLDLVIYIIGLASAVIDNVPLVAASMAMYDMSIYPQDHRLWEFLAYAAGTGGSILIIGSAAGVAVMGMEKIDFGWYVKRISLLAFIGYSCGAVAYLIIESLR